MQTGKFGSLKLTLLVFAVVQGIYLLLPQIADLAYWDPLTWKHFDSTHYISIAQEGYNFLPCSEITDFPKDSKDFCGNSGWFPGYPILIYVLSSLIGNPIFSAWLIALMCFFLSLYQVARLMKLEQITLNNAVNLLMAAFFFGSVYYMAVFPVSAVVFFCLWSFRLQLSKAYALTALPVFLCSVFYPTGFLLACVLALHQVVMNWKTGRWKSLATASIPVLSGLLAVLGVFYYFHISVGNWQAFILVQAKYGHGLHFPIRRMYEMYAFLSGGLVLKNTDVLQSTLVLIGYAWLMIRFFKRKQYQNPLYLLIIVFISAYFWFPWTVGGNLSRYRAEALLMPSVMLLFDLQLKPKLVLLSMFVMLGAVMSYLFFIEVLI